MSSPKGEYGINHEVKRVFCEVILPRRILPAVAQNVGARPDDQTLLLALERTRERVAEIIDHLPRINFPALSLRIPGPEFLELLLQTEYLYFNSLFGEQGTMKYLKRLTEPPGRTLIKLLNSYGYHRPEDLKAEERAALSGAGDKAGAEALEVMERALEKNQEGSSSGF